MYLISVLFVIGEYHGQFTLLGSQILYYLVFLDFVVVAVVW